MNELAFSWVIDGQLAGHAKLWNREDVDYLVAQGIKATVRLITDYDGGIIHSLLLSVGISDLNVPLLDGATPTDQEISRIMDFISANINEGKPVSISCFAGVGRTGTILALYLVHSGMGAKEALYLVRDKRGHLPETAAQLDAVFNYKRPV